VKTINLENAKFLLEDIGQRIKSAGPEGLPLGMLDAVDALLCGVWTMQGDAKLVNRDGYPYVVWLDVRAEHPPVIEEARDEP
jgi:hypothetical protein